jgi:hypothetical protein
MVAISSENDHLITNHDAGVPVSGRWILEVDVNCSFLFVVHLAIRVDLDRSLILFTVSEGAVVLSLLHVDCIFVEARVCVLEQEGVLHLETGWSLEVLGSGFKVLRLGLHLVGLQEFLALKVLPRLDGWDYAEGVSAFDIGG